LRYNYCIIQIGKQQEEEEHEKVVLQMDGKRDTAQVGADASADGHMYAVEHVCAPVAAVEHVHSVVAAVVATDEPLFAQKEAQNTPRVLKLYYRKADARVRLGGGTRVGAGVVRDFANSDTEALCHESCGTVRNLTPPTSSSVTSRDRGSLGGREGGRDDSGRDAVCKTSTGVAYGTASVPYVRLAHTPGNQQSVSVVHQSFLPESPRARAREWPGGLQRDVHTLEIEI
jgi:hypothetical protein